MWRGSKKDIVFRGVVATLQSNLSPFLMLPCLQLYRRFPLAFHNNFPVSRGALLFYEKCLVSQKKCNLIFVLIFFCNFFSSTVTHQFHDSGKSSFEFRILVHYLLTFPYITLNNYWRETPTAAIVGVRYFVAYSLFTKVASHPLGIAYKAMA